MISSHYRKNFLSIFTDTIFVGIFCQFLLKLFFSYHQIVECFPNTMPKELSDLVQKSKWTKPAKEIETWEQWWSMHQKIAKPLGKTAKVIHNWWSFTGILSNLK